METLTPMLTYHLLQCLYSPQCNLLHASSIMLSLPKGLFTPKALGIGSQMTMIP